MLIYQVYVGPRSRLYDFCTESVSEYCRAHGFAHYVQTEPILKIKPDPETSGRSEGAARLGYLPIFEKENAFAYLGVEHEMVAVIDADVWIRPGAPSIFDELGEDVEFAAVVERSLPLTKAYKRKIKLYSEGQYRRLSDVDWKWSDLGAEFMNMGVMVMNSRLSERLDGQSPRQFLGRPEFRRFVDGVGAWKASTDQTMLNWWIKKEGIAVQHLHWEWNCMFGAAKDEFLDDAHFVHFFLSGKLPSTSPEELLKKRGVRHV